ncbi:MAG: HNH endonuclease [Coriobacteriales bacterium]|jgi:hypothetical protein|nr:HNH endonuclease [Coriobacteriales bacterium]
MRAFAARFYNSRAWHRARRSYGISRHHLCEVCGKPADVVHHKLALTPQNIHDPNITLSWDNLQLLCADCHAKAHGMETTIGNRAPISFAPDGSIAPHPEGEVGPADTGVISQISSVAYSEGGVHG